MTHDECRGSLSAWLDGALTPEESKTVSGHIVACRECRTVSDEMRSLSAALRALPRHELPGDLKTTVLDAVGDTTSRAWMLRPWALASAAAFASVLVVIGVVGLRRPDAPQVARLDATSGKGYVIGELEDAPRESAAQEAISEPASPAPARQNQERFSPVPPAPPEDKPVSFDDLKKSAIGDETKEKRQDRNEAQEVAGITSLSSSVELDQTTTAAPSAEEPSLLEGSSLNYVARLIADGEGAWKLEPVEPPAVAGQKDDSATHDAEADAATRNREKSAAGGTSGSAGAVSGPAAVAGAPVTAREGERAADTADSRAAPGKLEAGSPNRMVFLVQLDAAGNITSAQLVGARTTSPEIAEAARKLLIGTRYPGSPMGRLSTATVRILVETPPPSR